MRDHRPDRQSALRPEHDDAADAALPVWAMSLLLEPVPSRSVARHAIMERVRAETAPRRTTVHERARMSAPMRPSRWNRRGLLSPFGAAALVCLLALVLGVRSVVGPTDSVADSPGLTASATVLRDTVLPAGTSVQDAFRAGLRDTLRVVELVLRGPDVRDASVVGDFNAWQRGATAMERRADGAWHVQVVVPRDVVRFAYVVSTRAQSSRPSGGTRVQLDSI